jgi:hypothetical protein
MSCEPAPPPAPAAAPGAGPSSSAVASDLPPPGAYKHQPYRPPDMPRRM